MPKKSTEELQKHTLNLYAGDLEKLRTLFPDQEPTVLVRELIHNTIKTIENSAESPNLNIEVKI